VRADGTIFVTDPEYLIAGVREQPFLNLYRIPPNGPPVAEWSGTPGVDGPSGVALSPDERILYMANTETGVVLAFDVSDSGGLSLRAPLAAGLTAPDGLCVDTAGTVFVATADGLRAFTPAGDPLGTLAFPDDVTNCAFGGADLRTLYVTTSVDLWSMPMAVPGIAGRN
jgi:gluconolactonase